MARRGLSALRRFGRHSRLYLGVLFTIVVVTYVGVPWVVSLIDAFAGYSPVYYEPKDFTRQEYIRQHGIRLRDVTPERLIVEILLVLLMVIVWMMLLSRPGTRRR